MHSKNVFLRIAVFWIWIATFVASIMCYIFVGIKTQNLNETIDALSRFTAFFFPQLGVMFAFYFNMTQTQQERIVVEMHAASTAIWLTIIYHITLWVLLLLGLILWKFGDKIIDATENIIRMMGFFSVLGTVPLAYLFTTTRQIRRASGKETK